MSISETRLRKLFLVGIIALLTGLMSAPVQAQSETLDISPVRQETPVWCWLAAGEMVHRHYGIPTLNPTGDYQCGLVATLAGPNTPCWNNCGNCVAAAGQFGLVNTIVADMVKRYPEVLRSMGRYQGPGLDVKWKYAALSDTDIRSEIDGGNPIIAGISPSGFPTNAQAEHIALVIGYEVVPGGMLVIVNDPFPFHLAAFGQHPDPYLAAGGRLEQPGRYSIDSRAFIQRLVWRESWYGIRTVDVPTPPPFAFRCAFQSEPGISYFVTGDNNIVGVLPNGAQRVVGSRISPTVPGFAWMYSTPVITYGVDPAGRVWSRTPQGQPFQVGMCMQP